MQAVAASPNRSARAAFVVRAERTGGPATARGGRLLLRGLDRRWPARHAGRMLDRDLTRLLFGPYKAPRLRKGDRAACLYRDTDIVVTGWTDAGVSWPCGRPVGTMGLPRSWWTRSWPAPSGRVGGGAALLVGVSALLVWKWRKALGVDRINCPGSP
jgi:hypothetical protein